MMAEYSDERSLGTKVGELLYRPVNGVWCFFFIGYWLMTLWYHMLSERLKSALGCSVNDSLLENGVNQPLVFKGQDEVGETLRITAVGDLIFEKEVLQCVQRRVNEAEPDSEKAVKRAYDTVFEEIIPYLNGDVIYGNLETVLGRNLSSDTIKSGGSRITLKKRMSPYTVFDQEVYGEKLLPSLNNHPALAGSLKHAGFNLVSTANNHSDDRLANGIDETIGHLNRVGLAHAGTLRSEEAKKRKAKKSVKPFVIMDVKGVRIALFSYTQRQNPFFKRCRPPNQAQQVYRFSPWYYTYAYYSDIDYWIDYARTECGAELVLVSAHWGIENNNFITPKQKRWAHSLFEAGADIVLGHHPHALQPMEKYTTSDGRETFVIYSLGNFVAGIEKMIHLVGAVFQIDLVKNPKGVFIKSISYLPTYSHFTEEPTARHLAVVPLQTLSEKEKETYYLKTLLGKHHMEEL